MSVSIKKRPRYWLIFNIFLVEMSSLDENSQQVSRFVFFLLPCRREDKMKNSSLTCGLKWYHLMAALTCVFQFFNRTPNTLLLNWMCGNVQLGSVFYLSFKFSSCSVSITDRWGFWTETLNVFVIETLEKKNPKITGQFNLTLLVT